jgi:hypothetical protein
MAQPTMRRGAEPAHLGNGQLTIKGADRAVLKVIAARLDRPEVAPRSLVVGFGAGPDEGQADLVGRVAALVPVFLLFHFPILFRHNRKIKNI